MGGLLITITGENLKSKQLDLGTGSTEESSGEGENFKVWFERNGKTVPCDVDRMMILHGKSLDGLDFLICQSRPMPEWSHWWIRVQIDDGPILKGDWVLFSSSNGPTVDRFYPQAAAPAKSANSNDYENTFWTEWYDLDDNDDGDEDESLAKHMIHDPRTFQRCQS